MGLHKYYWKQIYYRGKKNYVDTSYRLCTRCGHLKLGNLIIDKTTVIKREDLKCKNRKRQ